jgi:hypothetical protein
MHRGLGEILILLMIFSGSSASSQDQEHDQEHEQEKEAQRGLNR